VGDWGWLCFYGVWRFSEGGGWFVGVSGRAVLIPLGVTRETIEGVLRGLPRPDVIVVVTVPGYEETKRSIVEALRVAALALGARFYLVVVRPGGVEGALELYRVLRGERPGEVYLVGVTGSRYLFPVLSSVLLRYWRDTGARLWLVHGVEGREYVLEPFAGFFAPAMRISSVQKRLLRIVYESEEAPSGKEFIEKYGFTRSVYYVLADLERKGLLVVRRNRIEKTLPGRLFYALLKASGELEAGE